MLDFPVSQKKFDFERAVAELSGIPSPIDKFVFEEFQDDENDEGDTP